MKDTGGEIVEVGDHTGEALSEAEPAGRETVNTVVVGDGEGDCGPLSENDTLLP